MDEGKKVVIEPALHRSILRLMSWMPEYRTGAQHVALAGRELPTTVGGRLRGPIRVLCVGPGDWLVVSHQHHAVVVEEHYSKDTSKYGLVLVDLTDALGGLTVRGPMARTLLSKGCGLDFHPRAFPPEACARTRFAQIPVVIEAREEEGVFELYASWSQVKYLDSWLLDAAAEFAPVSQLGSR